MAFPPDNAASPLDDSTSITINGQECWDEGTLSEDFSATEPSVVRALTCAWANRLNFMVALGGGFVTSNSSSGSPVTSYVSPVPHPLFTWLWPLQVSNPEPIPSVNGMTNDTINSQSIAGYDFARLRVRYGRLPFDPTVITNGEISVQNGLELIRPSTTTPTLQWADGTAVPAADTLPIRVSTAVVTVTRYRCKNIPLGFNATIGCVNMAAFQGYAAGTVLFDGFDTTKEKTIGGDDTFTVRLRFIYKSCGWNVIWRPSQSSFQAVTTIAPATTITVPITDLTLSAGNFQSTSATVAVSVPTGQAGGKPPYPPADFSQFSTFF